MATQGEPTQPGHDAGGAQPYRLIYDNWKEAEARFKRSQTYVNAICAMCNTPTTKTCSTCGSVHYCSPICQKSDWPLHKLCCKVYALFEPDKRSRLVRTILFAVESEAPLPMITGLSVDPETGRFQVATWKDTLRMENDKDEEIEDKVETMCITRNPLRRRDLRGPGRAGTGKSDTYEGHVIVLKMRRDRENMPRNKALEACAKACGFDFASPLHGPVLALRQEIGAGLYRACTLQDLRDVVDYLRLHGTQDKHGLSYIQLKRAPVGGCSMACWGEYLSNGLDAVGPTLFP